MGLRPVGAIVAEERMDCRCWLEEQIEATVLVLFLSPVIPVSTPISVSRRTGHGSQESLDQGKPLGADGAWVRSVRPASRNGPEALKSAMGVGVTFLTLCRRFRKHPSERSGNSKQKIHSQVLPKNVCLPHQEEPQGPSTPWGFFVVGLVCCRTAHLRRIVVGASAGMSKHGRVPFGNGRVDALTGAHLVAGLYRGAGPDPKAPM